MLSTRKINTGCYLILAGILPNEGIVITRERDHVNRTESLSADKWYIAQTNRDYWLDPDERYSLTVAALEKVGQTGINEETIIEDVLHEEGVLQDITIFSAVLSAGIGLDQVSLVERVINLQ